MINQLRITIETRRAIADLVTAGVDLRAAVAALPRGHGMDAVVARVLNAAVAVGEHMLRMDEVQRQNQRTLAAAAVKRVADTPAPDTDTAASALEPPQPPRHAKRAPRGGTATWRRKPSIRPKSEAAVAEAARAALDRTVGAVVAMPIATTADDVAARQRSRETVLADHEEAKARRAERYTTVLPARKRLRANDAQPDNGATASPPAE